MTFKRDFWVFAVKDDMADHCYLFTDTFGRMIQILLTVVAIFILYVKRKLEMPIRPVKVWAMDVGKQYLGSGFIHCTSIIISVVMVAEANEDDDECGIYFVTYMLDTTFGVIVLLFFLRCIHILAVRNAWTDLVDSGYYGDPPQMKIWWKQFAAYTLVLVVMKFINTLIIWGWYDALARFSTRLFHAFSHHRHLELTLVMIIIPGSCNAFQFWIVDSYLKSHVLHDNYLGPHGEKTTVVVVSKSDPMAPSTTSADSIASKETSTHASAL